MTYNTSKPPALQHLTWKEHRYLTMYSGCNRHLHIQKCITHIKKRPYLAAQKTDATKAGVFFSFPTDVGRFSGDHLFPGEGGRLQVPVWGIPTQEGSWEEEEGWASRLSRPWQWAGSGWVDHPDQVGLPWAVPGNHKALLRHHLSVSRDTVRKLRSCCTMDLQKDLFTFLKHEDPQTQVSHDGRGCSNPSRQKQVK